jgi:hypothetical protein
MSNDLISDKSTDPLAEKSVDEVSRLLGFMNINFY